MAKLRNLLERPGCLFAPGVYDPLTAKLAEDAGFEVAAISGFGVEATRFGLPDYGFLGTTDISEVADRIVDAVEIPIICDIDTGFGGVRNIWQTVRRLEKLGVQAVHIEDQTFPKMCGAMPGREVVPVPEMLDKLSAALDARRSDDFILIARTDAKDSLGLQAVIDRMNAFLEAGAVMVLAAESYTGDELRELGRHVAGPLAICVGVPGWPGSFETTETYASWGIRLAIAPFICLMPTVNTVSSILARVRQSGGASEGLVSETFTHQDQVNSALDIADWMEREHRVRAKLAPV